jgi:hypothetical protein
VLTLLAASTACGGNSPQPAKPTPRPDASVAVATGGGSAQPVSDALTERDCDALLAHVVQVSIAERPADQQIDASEQAKIQADARSQFQTECRGFARATYDCAMAANATTAIEACP